MAQFAPSGVYGTVCSKWSILHSLLRVEYTAQFVPAVVCCIVHFNWYVALWYVAVCSSCGMLHTSLQLVCCIMVCCSLFTLWYAAQFALSWVCYNLLQQGYVAVCTDWVVWLSLTWGYLVLVEEPLYALISLLDYLCLLLSSCMCLCMYRTCTYGDTGVIMIIYFGDMKSSFH